MHRLALVALLVLLAPTAQAGREEDPEVLSPRDRDNFNGDLLAVWLEHHPEGLKVTFKVGGVGARDRLALYSLEMRLGDETHRPAVGLDRDGRLRTDSGANPSGWGGPRVSARVDDALLAPELHRGGPAYLSAVVPWGLYPGLAPGAEVRVVEASSAVFDGRTQRWLVQYDRAEARTESFVVAPAPAGFSLPILVPAWVLPTIVVASTLCGALCGVGVARLTRPRPEPAAAPAPREVRAPPPPPGARFRRDPLAQPPSGPP